MNHIPSELHYTSTHEWVRLEQNNEAVVGITHHAQMMLGDMVFAELPELGLVLLEGDDVAVVESVKAASDVYAPVSGTITAVNQDVVDAPELVNQDAYAAWLFKLRLDDPAELEQLLSAAAYLNTTT